MGEAPRQRPAAPNSQLTLLLPALPERVLSDRPWTWVTLVGVESQRDTITAERDTLKAEVDRLEKLTGKAAKPPASGGGGGGDKKLTADEWLVAVLKKGK